MYLIEIGIMAIVALIAIVATWFIPKVIEINRNRFFIPMGFIFLGIVSAIIFIFEVFKLGKLTNFDIYAGFLIDGGAIAILFILLKEFNLIKAKPDKKAPKKKNKKKIKLHSEDEEWDCIEE